MLFLLCAISYVVCVSPAFLDHAFVFEFGALLRHASNNNGDDGKIFILSFDGKTGHMTEVAMLRRISWFRPRPLLQLFPVQTFVRWRNNLRKALVQRSPNGSNAAKKYQQIQQQQQQQQRQQEVDKQERQTSTKIKSLHADANA